MPDTRLSLLIGAAFAVCACRYQPTPVELQGAEADLSTLAGSWDGDYSSVQSGRSGNITFKVTAGSDSAYGDVLMVPRMGQPFTAADVESRAHAMHASSPTALRVTFVRVRGGMVEGELEPYIAPDCKCEVSTVFRGAVRGDVIDGTYTTRGRDIPPQEGQWKVRRAK